MDHAVGANESLFPGLGAEEASLDEEGHRLSQQLIEALDGHFDESVLVYEDGFFTGGVLADGGQPIAQAAFGREEAVLEAEASSVVGVAGFA